MPPSEKSPLVSRTKLEFSPSTQDVCEEVATEPDYELFAAAVGNVEWLRYCLKRRRRAIPADGKGFTAIHFAAQHGKLACLQILVEEYRFPVDLPTHSGQTPLHLVIHRENKTMILPCVHYLLKKKAALNAQTCRGCTPLHLAACEGLLACVKVLVQSGANVHARDVRGLKPIDFCKIWNHRACARYLKDAMWKRDKKDFALEMEKLKKLKDQLALMEKNYLIQQQEEYKSLAEADFKKWLRGKQLPPGQPLHRKREQEPGALPEAAKSCRPPKPFQPALEARLWRQRQPRLQPTEALLVPVSRPPGLRRAGPWNFSSNPARSPRTQLACAQGIRLGVHADPSRELDFRNFVEVRPDGQGGALLRTAAGHRVAPVPRLPFQAVVGALHPSLRLCRMKVPEGFRPVSMRNVPRKRHLGDDTFWTDTLAMNLRETFDETFLTAVRAHQGLPALPSPQPPP
nr:ankyrin repeat domain-containing protein 53 [Dasypus novemcinctus]